MRARSRVAVLASALCLLAFGACGAPRGARGAAPVAAAPSAGDAHRAPDLDSLYESHQWFELRRAVRAAQPSALHRGALASAFNETARADSLLRACLASADARAASEARGLLIYACQRAGRYREALSLVEGALALEPANANLKNARAFFAVLSRSPEPPVAEGHPSKFRGRLEAGNLFVPVEINGRAASYIVDTGANFSLISEGEARRLGLTLHDGRDSKVTDAAGAEIGVRVAVADRLTLGRLRLRHVVFLVVGDEQQPFLDLPARERGVLGLPVLLAIRTLRWHRDGTIEAGFASAPTGAHPAPLCFDGAQVIAEAEYGTGRVTMFVDTGATRTRALPLFARQFAGMLGDSARRDSVRVTGVGGSTDVAALTIPELTLRIGGVPVTLRPAQVLLNETTPDSRWWHVWCGWDLLEQASVVTIDLASMTLELE